MKTTQTIYSLADGSKTVAAQKGYEASALLGTEDTIYGCGPDGWCASTGGAGAGESTIEEDDVPSAAREAIKKT